MKRSFNDCVAEEGMMFTPSSSLHFPEHLSSSSLNSNNYHCDDDDDRINERKNEHSPSDDGGDDNNNGLMFGMTQKKIKRNSSSLYNRNSGEYNYSSLSSASSLITMNGCSGMKSNQSGFELMGCVGCYGAQSGQFKNPSDVAIDFTYQLIFIVDTDNRRIQVFDESTLNFKYMFVTPFKPNSVTVHWDHSLIISFTRESLICKYDYNGNEKWKWGGVSTKNVMDSPTGVVVDFEGNIYVCDWFKHRIIVFSPNGQLLRSIGSMGKDYGQFSFPRDIDMDSVGNLIVSDSGNNRIQILKSTGEFISSFGSLGNDKGEFQAPNSVFVDKSTGYIFLTEWDSHRISKFHPNNPFSGSTCVGSFGNMDSSLKYPSGIAFCYGSSRLLIIDSGNHRIKIYRVI